MIGMAGKLGIGVIGCGGMGTSLAKTCLKIPYMEVVATCDPIETQARILATDMKCDHYSRVDDLLDRSDIDAVIVATPNFNHCESTVAALKAGKHVFCEKPMALTLKDCDLMIHTAEDSGLTLMIGHVMRFYSGCASVKKAMETGEIGLPVLISVSRSGWMDVGEWKESWRHSKEMCGNSLFESAIHEIDLMRWFFGDVQKVQAYGSNFGHPELEYDDCTIAIFRFENSALGALQAGYAYKAGDHKIVLNGTKGAACIDFKTSTARVIAEAKTEHVEPLMKGTELVWHGGLIAELQHFAGCTSKGMKPLVDGWEGRRAVEIVTAIDQAAESGKSVDLPLRY